MCGSASSDMCVPLAALDAIVKWKDPKASDKCHRLPSTTGQHPQRDTNLKPGELITVILPPRPVCKSQCNSSCAIAPPMPLRWFHRGGG